MGAVLGDYGSENVIKEFKDQSDSAWGKFQLQWKSFGLGVWSPVMERGLELFTELQIWRPVSGENGSYAKVGSTTIIVTAENPLQLYHYPLSAQLPWSSRLGIC